MSKYDWWAAHYEVWTLNIEQFGGHKDWRLPTVNELISIVDYEKTNPACKLADMAASYYWSSTTYADNTGLAWSVYFGLGIVGYYNKANSNYVRAVRSTQTDLEWSETL